MNETFEIASDELKQTVVLVLGMPHSGASLLSSLMRALVADVGERFYPAATSNSDGDLDQDYMEIQERLLEALGRPRYSEKGMLPLPPIWWREPAMHPLVQELANWIDRRISVGASIWVLNDPRTTPLLPLWQELLQVCGITPRFVLTVRHPAEVTKLGAADDQVPAQHIYHTWLRYNMDTLLHAGADLAGVFVYAHWFTNGIANLRRLSTLLGVNRDDNECVAILDRVLRSELHREDGCNELSPTWAGHLYARLEGLADELDLDTVRRLAAEAEYFDAMLRQGQTPPTDGALEAVLTSVEELPAALNLAHSLRIAGARVVMAVDGQAPTIAATGVALMIREYNGPVLGGTSGQHICAAYSLWCWLQRRAYRTVHIEGGHGLAVHCLDARRQGWQNDDGAIYVHYFRPPPWLEKNGRPHLSGVLDAEALCLERRVLSDSGCLLLAPPALETTLRQLVDNGPGHVRDAIPVAQDTPLVSICITHYNRPTLLHDCLASVRAQTYSPLEVVLVDDGSTQPAAQAFLYSLQGEFAAKGWTLIRQENRYLGAARNAAARAAKGDYLFFLDDDNLLMPNGVQQAVRVAQHTGADIVTAIMAQFSGPAGCQPTRPDTLVVHAGSAPLLGLFDNNLGDANALIRRNCWIELGGCTEDRDVGAEDWEFYAKAILNGRRLEHSLKPFLWYRVDSNSMARAGNWWSNYRRALRAYEALLPVALRELPALAGVLWRRVTALEPFESEAAHLRSQVDKLRVLTAETNEQLARASDDARRFASQFANAEAALVRLSAQLNSVPSSSARKMPRPLHDFLTRHPRTSQTLRRAAKLIWWTVTLQLPTRLAARRQLVNAHHAPATFSPTPSPHRLSKNELSLAAFSAEKKKIFTAQARSELLDFLASGERLVLPPSKNPDVSVIVILWNQAHLTFRCVRALLGQYGPSLEIVLFDNNSSDETADLLSRIDGAQVIRNDTNDGFLIGCNKAVAASHGRVVLLLNSDAFVRAGALSSALTVLDENVDVGAVGGRLILPSGQLQEAGSIVWSDGSTSGYGRGLPPEAGEAMFRRDVDYCSGAFLMTPRVLWDRLDGFDEAFKPAYYEETDYCMRLRALGYRTVYEPTAVIDHYEFGSEEKRGDSVKASLRNRKILRTRHAEALRLHHLPPTPANILVGREVLRTNRGRLLVIDNELPVASLGSGYPRMRQILAEAISLGWAVTFFPLHRPDVDWEKAHAELSVEIEIASGRGSAGLGAFLEERKGYYDILLVSRPDNMALLVDTCRGRPHVLDGCRLVYDAEALFCLRDIAKATIDGLPTPDADFLISSEVYLAAGADAVVCVSQAEADTFRLRMATTTPVYTLSHPTAIASNAPCFSERAGFLFVGRLLEHGTPNWHGLSWFIRKCWPLIRLALPDAKLSVIGHLHPDHTELEAPGVHLCGPIADLQPFYDSARIFVAPVRFAAGIPLKILEATAAGLPSAGTRLMARQLVWTPGIEMVAEDDPATLAAAIMAIYRDADLWDRMRGAATERLRQDYSEETFRTVLKAILDGNVLATEVGPMARHPV
jgi:GT2 family glycosyltransferase